MSESGKLLYRSNLLGSDKRITNFGGGNTSAKVVERDPVSGAPVEVLWVKGSGGDLGSMALDGFATLYMDKLRALKGVYRGPEHEDEMVGYLPHCTLAHPDQGIRDFWIEHGRRSREIAARIGEELGSAAVNNIWVPDGSKDIPVDRMAARRRLEASLDAMIAPGFDTAHVLDAVESKLFGIGVEAMTVGSHEFYLGYAIRNKILLCLDMGHFHPTENIADKLSAVALSVDELLLHVSRPMRWDSDHVILLSDDILQMAQELVFAGLLGRTHIGLDFFDATISRTAAWVIGTRNMQKALLRALLLPQARLKQAEEALDHTARLVLTEELKDLPFAAVWAEYCARMDAPVGQALIADLDAYQASVAARG